LGEVSCDLSNVQSLSGGRGCCSPTNEKRILDRQHSPPLGATYTLLNLNRSLQWNSRSVVMFRFSCKSRPRVMNLFRTALVIATAFVLLIAWLHASRRHELELILEQLEGELDEQVFMMVRGLRGA